MTQSKSRQPVIPGSTGSYAVLPLRDIVVFPHMIVPLFVGREKSIRALEEAVRSDRHILLATQINAGDDDPATDAIYKIGTLASVLQLLKLPDGTVKVLVEGVGRAKIANFTRSDEYYEATALALHDELGDQVEAEALARSVLSEFENYVKLNKKISPRSSPPSRRSTSRPSSPTRSARTCSSRSPTSRASWRRRPSPSAWRRCCR